MSDLTEFKSRFLAIQTELLERSWTEGRNPDCSWDGDHFRIPGTVRPLTISRVESAFLANLVAATNASNVLEIGTAFGYSAAWLAYGLAHTAHDGLVHTVDDGSEGVASDIHLDLALEIWARLGLANRIKAIKGTSPRVIDDMSELIVDIAFIDGEHRGGQPLRDYGACSRRLSSSGLIVFHDAQAKYDVREAVAKAEADGFTVVPLGTSCEMVVAIRQASQIGLIETTLLRAKQGLIVDWQRDE